MCGYPKGKKNIYTQDIFQIPSLKCANILYTNKNKNTKANFQSYKSYMCTYPLQQHKHKHKHSLPNLPVLHVYLSSTTTQT